MLKRIIYFIGSFIHRALFLHSFSLQMTSSFSRLYFLHSRHFFCFPFIFNFSTIIDLKSSPIFLFVPFKYAFRLKNLLPFLMITNLRIYLYFVSFLYFARTYFDPKMIAYKQFYILKHPHLAMSHLYMEILSFDSNLDFWLMGFCG